MNGLQRLYLALAAILLLTSCTTTSPQRPDAERPSDEMTESATASEAPVYTPETFLSLVRKYTVDGGEKVDYEAWKASPADLRLLDEQVTMIARISPDSHPDRFSSRSAARSYWINSYNTLVLHAVLEYWPLDSVRDVKLSLSSRVVPGKGFFYDRKVVVGGEKTNLYRLEKQVLRTQKDPRLHFALNCASESCPVLRPWEWTDEQLDDAAREFVNRPENVEIADGRLYLSSIFKWYRKDFPAEIHDYLAQYAEPRLRDRLEVAVERDYPVEYRSYDWSLNDSKKTGDTDGR
jgi:hypothetical protein